MKRSRSRPDVQINTSSDGIMDNNMIMSKEYEQHFADNSGSKSISGIYIPPLRHNQYTINNTTTTSSTNNNPTTNDNIFDVKPIKGKRMHQSHWSKYNIFSSLTNFWNASSNHTVLPITRRTLPLSRKVRKKRRM